MPPGWLLAALPVSNVVVAGPNQHPGRLAVSVVMVMTVTSASTAVVKGQVFRMILKAGVLRCVFAASRGSRGAHGSTAFVLGRPWTRLGIIGWRIGGYHSDLLWEERSPGLPSSGQQVEEHHDAHEEHGGGCQGQGQALPGQFSDGCGGVMRCGYHSPLSCGVCQSRGLKSSTWRRGKLQCSLRAGASGAPPRGWGMPEQRHRCRKYLRCTPSRAGEVASTGLDAALPRGHPPGG